MSRKRVSLIAVVGALIAISGCTTSGDENDDEVARLDELFFEQSAIRVGETARLLVDFTFASDDVFDNDRHVIIKLSLPAGTAYEQGSAEVDKRGSDDDVNPEQVERCPDGGSVVTFDLDDNDLSNVDDPAGDADGTLKLSVLGTRAIGAVTIEGRAGYDFAAGSCAAGIIPEAAVVLDVTR